MPVVKSNTLLAVGEGSNLLFTKNFDGVVLHSAIKQIRIVEESDNDVYVEAGAGVNWDDFVAYCVEKNWYGVENLSVIPGEVGASAVQNIGAYGVEVKDVISTVNTVRIKDGSVKTFSNAECQYDYRDSIFKNKYKGEYIITSVVFHLKKNETYCLAYQHLESAVRQSGDLNLANVRKTIINIRNSKLPDPKVLGNGGSFFKNPVVDKNTFENLSVQYPNMPHYYVSETEEKLSAAWLIDQAEWKGKSIGCAGVHDKQPLVLVNLGNAAGSEIIHLAEEIQRTVKKKFGISLHPEVNYI